MAKLLKAIINLEADVDGTLTASPAALSSGHDELIELEKIKIEIENYLSSKLNP